MPVRAVIVLALLGLAIAGLGASAGLGQSAGPEFADWTAVGTGSASGTLLGRPISISGGTISPLPGSVVDGSSTLFSGPEFTPPLPRSDAPEMRVSDPASVYTIDLGGNVADPVLHLASLASTLTFPAGTQLVRRSGDPGFAVTGTIVSGPATEDVEGTVQLLGAFRQISFSARYTRTQLDGVAFQVGGTLPPAGATPTPGAPAGDSPTQPPVPLAGAQVVARVASGDVRVRTASGDAFGPLSGTAALPVGAVVDARKGRLVLDSAVGGTVQRASIAAGIFAIRQRRANAPELGLITPPGRARACAGRHARPRSTVRKLVISVPKGVIRATGMKGMARGRNAAWSISDRCDGTLTRVRKGRVAVSSGHGTVRVRPGREYLIRARLFGARARR